MNEAFIRMAKTDVSYDYFSKEKFHRAGRALLRKIAKQIGLAPGTFDVRSNLGGDAVSGEVTLHGETIYIQFSQNCAGLGDRFMWRSCNGRKDCTGGHNRWMKWDELADLDTACEQFRKVALAPEVV